MTAAEVKATLRQPVPLSVGEVAELLRHGIDPNGMRQLRAVTASLRTEVQDLRGRLAEAEDELCAAGRLAG